jgi:cytochrome c oxidase cbb3-type subunit 3
MLMFRHPLALALILLAADCKRERRLYEVSPPEASVMNGAATQSPYEGNAWASGEGKRLFYWFNCSGCHANGGGGMGPPLMDDKWLYGSEPSAVLSSILDGRPNGMPAFRDRISEDQAWKLVDYVRSMSHLTPALSRPGRRDHMRTKAPENL